MAAKRRSKDKFEIGTLVRVAKGYEYYKVTQTVDDQKAKRKSLISAYKAVKKANPLAGHTDMVPGEIAGMLLASQSFEDAMATAFREFSGPEQGEIVKALTSVIIA